MKSKDNAMALVFISAIISSALLVFAEITQAGQPFNQLTAFWRIPLGLYLILFPTGFLFYSFLFPHKEEVVDAEGFGLSIALSISAISLSILIANMLLHFPITLLHGLIIITGLNVIFYSLFLFRERMIPYLDSLWSDYNARIEPRFDWSKFVDQVFFAGIIVFLFLLADVIVKNGEEFDQILSFLSIPLLPFFILFPTGYLLLSPFFSRKRETYSKKMFTLNIALSIACFFIAFLLVFVFSLFFSFNFTLLKVLALLLLFNIIIYILFLLIERIIPFLHYLFIARRK